MAWCIKDFARDPVVGQRQPLIAQQHIDLDGCNGYQRHKQFVNSDKHFSPQSDPWGKRFYGSLKPTCLPVVHGEFSTGDVFDIFCGPDMVPVPMGKDNQLDITRIDGCPLKPLREVPSLSRETCIYRYHTLRLEDVALVETKTNRENAHCHQKPLSERLTLRLSCGR